MLNQVVLIGRLANDPELRYTPSGLPVANFVLAVGRPPSSQGGERTADFVPIVVWSKQAEACHNSLNKGRLVAVEGRLQIRSYDTPDGQRRKVAEVVARRVQFLDRPREPREGGAPAGGPAGGADLGPAGEQGEEPGPEDDLPF